MHRISGPQRHVKRTRSAAQLKRNHAFLSCCLLWQNHSTPALIKQWQNFATAPETAFNAFVRIMIVYFYNDVKIKLPPVPPG